MRDGGYRSKTWWSEEGWRWRTFRNAKWPTFWVPEGPQGKWQVNLATSGCSVDSYRAYILSLRRTQVIGMGLTRTSFKRSWRHLCFLGCS